MRSNGMAYISLNEIRIKGCGNGGLRIDQILSYLVDQTVIHGQASDVGG